MTDKYKDLRDALDAGPTPGQWRAEMVYDAGYAHINFDSREWNTLRGFCGEANAKYIAAANPETIRALLAERDALRKFVEAKMHHLPIEDQYVASVLVGELAQGKV